MLTIYNTLSRKKEIFKPIHPGRVNIYVCGVTVYDYCHLGHARTYTSADIIIRYLRFRGFQVNHVRNITDIDDKIIKRAAEQNEKIDALTSRFTKAMHEDFASLKLLPPDHEPRATEYVPQMISLIEKIIKNGNAYIGANGDVYFDVRSFSKYGSLSHHDIESLESGARVEVSEVKRDPLDFALWKIAKPGEPFWESPWGNGRPGWHIECSTMSMDLLGEHFDIHGGGRDLIFPHHENEIAQSQAGTHAKFANVWVHGGFLQIQKEKMSKSLGNFITIREVLRDHDPEVVRYVLLSSHYRSPLIYAEETFAQAKSALERFYTALRFLDESEKVTGSVFEKQFIDAMDDDFNTPIALSVLFELAHEVQRLRDKNPEDAKAHGALLKYLGNVLGILEKDPDEFFQSDHDIDIQKIENLIKARQIARSEKNWKEADRIRSELSTMNITIEDGANGTTWKKVR
jgi:cysteinyl-tRNA synthetase